MSKKLYLIVCFFIGLYFAYSEIPYPFLHVPGMFDNGDNCTSDNNLIVTLNNPGGYYYNNYFTEDHRYDRGLIGCSSNIVGSKYNRVSIANVIGDERKNISLVLMAQRIFCLIHGYAYPGQSWGILTSHRGNDYTGVQVIDNKEIEYRGVIENLWLLYGKKVIISKRFGKYRVVLERKWYDTDTYILDNPDGYFDSYNDIKLNLVVHSSGGLALREYMRMAQNLRIQNHVNLIVNLSIPQRGATITLNLRNGFNELITGAIDGVFAEDKADTVVVTSSGARYTYKEVIDSTIVDMLYGDTPMAISLKQLLTTVILYFIPFDTAGTNVLGTDPALWDLNPRHSFVKQLNTTAISPEIRIYNYRVKDPYSAAFRNIGRFTGLGESDGAVAFTDTDLSFLPGYENLRVQDIIVDHANHIPFPYIKPLFELTNTLDGYYPLINILIRKPENRQKSVELTEALMLCVLNEFGLNLPEFMANYNYSVIDYFADHPVDIRQ